MKDGVRCMPSTRVPARWSGRRAPPAADYTSASPVLGGGRVFVPTLSRVSGHWMTSIEAFSAADGRHLWHASTRPSKMFWFMPVSADASLVAYASEHGYLYAFDASTGALRWEVPDITNTLRPAIVNGLVWAEDVDGRFLALDARDGHQLWGVAAVRSRSAGLAGDRRELRAGRRQGRAATGLPRPLAGRGRRCSSRSTTSSCSPM
jgi:outer membrane protein assembly factor BamB